MQVTISTVYDLPDIQHMPKHRMEFLDYKAGVKQVLSPDNPFNKVADDPPKDFFYEMGSANSLKFNLTAYKLFQIIEEVTTITKAQIKEYDRSRQVVTARSLFSYFMCKYSNMTYKSIGLEIGGRDHTTVIHARQSISNLVDVNDEYIMTFYNKIQRSIKLLIQEHEENAIQ